MVLLSLKFYGMHWYFLRGPPDRGPLRKFQCMLWDPWENISAFLGAPVHSLGPLRKYQCMLWDLWENISAFLGAPVHSLGPLRKCQCILWDPWENTSAFLGTPAKISVHSLGPFRKYQRIPWNPKICMKFHLIYLCLHTVIQVSPVSTGRVLTRIGL